MPPTACTPSPLHAVLFAVKIQQELLLATWPEALLRHDKVSEKSSFRAAHVPLCTLLQPHTHQAASLSSSRQLATPARPSPVPRPLARRSLRHLPADPVISRQRSDPMSIAKQAEPTYMYRYIAPRPLQADPMYLGVSPDAHSVDAACRLSSLCAELLRIAASRWVWDPCRAYTWSERVTCLAGGRPRDVPVLVRMPRTFPATWLARVRKGELRSHVWRGPACVCV